MSTLPILTMSMIGNEVLCYLSFSFKRLNRSLLVSTLSSFFHEDELSEAKSHLCTAASAHTPAMDGWAKLITSKGLPINRKGNDGQHKRDLEADDVVSMFTLLDVHQVLMPTFVARPSKLDRVPSLILSSSFNKGTVDVVTTSLDSMSSTLGEFLRRLEKVELHFGNADQPQVRGAPSLHDLNVAHGNSSSAVQVSTSQSSDQPPSWADRASKLSTSVAQFNFPAAKPAVLQKPVIRGNRQMPGCAIKTVQRLLTCFVSRLDKDTL